MSNKNWDAELAKIDKQLASISDEQLLATAPAAAGQGAPGAAGTARGASARQGPAASVTTVGKAAAGRSWVAWLKVVVAVGAAAGLMFWPWPVRCGGPLIGFTAATGGVALLGLWSALGTWRHRLGLAHAASLLVTAWGIGLGAREVLPRVGYAVPTEVRGASWACEGLPLLAPPQEVPGGSPLAPPQLPSGAPQLGNGTVTPSASAASTALTAASAANAAIRYLSPA